MDPLPYWLHNDAPDRQGITEMKYVAGLYAYWDRLAKAWPVSADRQARASRRGSTPGRTCAMRRKALLWARPMEPIPNIPTPMVPPLLSSTASPSQKVTHGMDSSRDSSTSSCRTSCQTSE